MCNEKINTHNLKNIVSVEEQISICKDLNIHRNDDKVMVFDQIRNKFVALTPEEIVRQSFISFLLNNKNYSKALLANEVEIQINGKKLRCDTVVYNKKLQPIVIVEYKQPNVSISKNTLNQIINYTFLLKAKYIIVTNGKQTYCGKLNENSNTYTAINKIPCYSELL